MIIKLVLVVTLFCYCGLAQQNETEISLDEVIDQVFKSTTESILDIIKPFEERPSRCPESTSKCVPYYMCSSTIKEAEVILDIAYNEDSPCVDYLETCCRFWDVSENATVAVDPKPNPNPTCGKRNPKGISFTTMGNDGSSAEFGEFPWMVAITREITFNGTQKKKFQCGGSLIHPSVVLTAAHCAPQKFLSTMLVRAGEWDTQTKSEFYKHQEQRVKEILVHPEFNKDNLRNDIALIILTSQFDTNPATSPHIGTLCLPPANMRFDGSNCVASGWGKNLFGEEGIYQVILKKVELPIVNSNECEVLLRKTRLGRLFKLHDSFICAGGIAGKDTCKGDGGSPLACPIPGSIDRYYQAGIVSWGLGCNQDRTPGAYANVAHLRNWIDQELKSKGITLDN